MRIGIDLDNTIINYDRAFYAAAVARGWVPETTAPTKQAVKATLADDHRWQHLQGYVYGQGIGAATVYEGVEDFLKSCAAQNTRPFIVSHKTEFGHFDETKTNLRDAARTWLIARGIVGSPWGVAAEHVYFETTRAAKVARIAALGCDIFIDDLAEVFDEPGFPATTQPRLFAPNGHQRPHYTHWSALHACVKRD